MLKVTYTSLLPGLLICDRQTAHPWPETPATLATAAPAWNYPQSLKNREIRGFVVSRELLLPHTKHQMELAFPAGSPNPLT